jgi:hypothetical protein
LLEDKSSKGPVVKLPAGTKLLPPKHNEKLVGVKTNKKGEIVCTKYSTREHTTSKGFVLIQAKSNSFHPRKLLNTPFLRLKLHASVARL